MKMILADDEAIIINGIQKLMNWEQMGIELVGTYLDGKSAFEGILQQKPDVALLDISMPGMSGIEILKECSLLQLNTQIIFISGFQDFEYAREALKYGAAAYLLKPIIREELTNALEGCFEKISSTPNYRQTAVQEQMPDYGKLTEIEEICYRPVYVEVCYQEAIETDIKKLIHFSVLQFLESFIEEERLGIVFAKQNAICIVLKEKDEDKKHTKELLERIRDQTLLQNGQRVAFIVGNQVEHMSEIEKAFQECLAQKGILFFETYLEKKVFFLEEIPTQKKEQPERFNQSRDALISVVVNQKVSDFDRMFGQFQQMVCFMSRGKREDACYYFCLAIRQTQSQMEKRGIVQSGLEMADLLEVGRATDSYSTMSIAYKGILEGLMDGARKETQSNEKQTCMRVKEYIETHYAQDLTLTMMAEYVHMNPYYFSAFFKKYSGENFKSYVTRVRLEKALPLLTSSNKKILDISMEVGFADTRAFSCAFQKAYNETPNSYRKRLWEK